jgi:hypothetical protein
MLAVSMRTQLEGDRFNVGLDPRAAGRLKGAEQAIGDLVGVDHGFESGSGG